MDVSSKRGLDHFQSTIVSCDPRASLVVRSCAGSGKSTTLAARAGSLIAQGVRPDSLLVLTFSVRSKEDLMAKLARILQSNQPRVMTHHAHALQLLRQGGCTARIISASEQRKIVRNILSSSGPPTRQAIKNGLSIVARAKSVASPPSADDQRLLDNYQAALYGLGAIDFEDMIIRAIALLDEAAGSSPIQYSHVLLDEAQDTSETQLALLQRIAPRGYVPITAVGDADQTIYSFRGSRADILARISSWWRCQEMVLPTNYRCGSAIVETAKALIERSSLREPLSLLSAHAIAGRGEVRIRSWDTRAAELHWLANDLASICCNVETSIAVLCRTNAQTAEIIDELKHWGVPCSRCGKDASAKSGSSDVLLATAHDAIAAHLRLIFHPDDDASFQTAVRSPPRTGFTPPGNGRVSPCLEYLKILQHNMRNASLLQAAQTAAAQGFPRVSRSPSSSMALTSPQQHAVRGLLCALAETSQELRQASTLTRPSHMVKSIAARLGLAAHLDKESKTQLQKKKAFTVRCA